jgi:hypothetical protein
VGPALVTVGGAIEITPPDMPHDVVRAPAVLRHEPELIIPAPTVTPVASSIRMKEPVVRFFE